MYAIKTEKKADYWEVEALFDLCFAPGREALSSYRLRENSNPISELWGPAIMPHVQLS